MIENEKQVDAIVSQKGLSSRVVALGEEADTVGETGIAVAFGKNRNASIKGTIGYAVSFGVGTAKTQTAVSLLSTGGIALSDRIAVKLNQAGAAVGRRIAFADNLESSAQSENVAIAVGTLGLADGVISISLGKEGRAVAREDGLIALALFDQYPGRWEKPFGCDPCGVDRDDYLRDLKVTKVGEGAILANHIHQLDKHGEFVAVGLADAPRKSFS